MARAELMQKILADRIAGTVQTKDIKAARKAASRAVRAVTAAGTDVFGPGGAQALADAINGAETGLAGNVPVKSMEEALAGTKVFTIRKNRFGEHVHVAEGVTLEDLLEEVSAENEMEGTMFICGKSWLRAMEYGKNGADTEPLPLGALARPVENASVRTKRDGSTEWSVTLGKLQ